MLLQDLNFSLYIIDVIYARIYFIGLTVALENQK